MVGKANACVSNGLGPGEFPAAVLDDGFDHILVLGRLSLQFPNKFRQFRKRLGSEKPHFLGSGLALFFWLPRVLMYTKGREPEEKSKNTDSGSKILT